MSEPTRRYRHPSESNYARLSWWAGHGAELIGAVAGFAVGFVVLLVINVIDPTTDAEWIPWLTMLVGALGLRAIIRRQLQQRHDR